MVKEGCFNCFCPAVRSGDVGKFDVVRAKYVDQFKGDGTFTLILRLHHNVIKTAIRRISLAYSRISLADVAAKLKLESPKDAEYIIAKVSTIHIYSFLISVSV